MQVLSCQCGRQIRVTEGDAGASLPCDCGRTINVPSLGELRPQAVGDELPESPPEGSRRSQVTRVGCLFLSATIIITAVGAFWLAMAWQGQVGAVRPRRLIVAALAIPVVAFSAGFFVLAKFVFEKVGLPFFKDQVPTKRPLSVSRSELRLFWIGMMLILPDLLALIIGFPNWTMIVREWHGIGESTFMVRWPISVVLVGLVVFRVFRRSR